MEVRRLRPYWGLEVVLDGRTSEVCRPLAGVVLPADHPFWRNHIPPLHFGCRTALVTYTRREGERRATPTPPDHPPQEGFGRPPGRSAWSPEPRDYHPELWGAYLRALGRAYPEADRRLEAIARGEREAEATDWLFAAARVVVASFPGRPFKVDDPNVRALLGPEAPRLLQKHAEHVILDQQFRPDLSPEEYLEALRKAVTHPEAAVVVQAPPRGPVALAIAPSEGIREFLGPRALPWVVVVYDLRYGTLVTGYLASSLERITLWPNRTWLRTNPRLSS